MQINKICCEIPQRVRIAISGGVDSMAALGFLLRGRRDVELLHFDHGTEHGAEARDFILNISEQLKIPCHIGKIEDKMPKGRSAEDWWREQRYAFFARFNDLPIITAHHLDDVVETYIFRALHGRAEAGMIPIRREHVIRPFLAFEKNKLKKFLKPELGFVEDPTNGGIEHMRCLIRNRIVPEAFVVNPGLRKTVLRMYNQ